MAPPEQERGAFASHQLRAAFFARYLHAFASTLLVVVAIAIFFAREAESRRAWWTLMADVLGANGVASLFGLPVLIAITARWRRAPLRPFERVDLDAELGHVVVRIDGGEVHHIPRDRLAEVQVERAANDRSRIGLTMGGRWIRDRYVLEVGADVAERVLAFLGPRRAGFDLGVRSLESAGWSFTLSYAAACAAAMFGSMMLRPHVPLLPFEPWSTSESTGWILGLGAAGFGPAHAFLAWWTRPPRITLGVDGVSVERGRRALFHPWTDLVGATAERTAVVLLRADGRRDHIPLRSIDPPRIHELARAIGAHARAASDAAATASPEIEATTLGTAYRVRSDEEDRFERELMAPISSSKRRFRAAEELLRRGPSGREALRVAALAIAEREVRERLEHLATEESAEVERAADVSEEHPPAARRFRAH